MSSRISQNEKLKVEFKFGPSDENAKLVVYFSISEEDQRHIEMRKEEVPKKADAIYDSLRRVHKKAVEAGKNYYPQSIRGNKVQGIIEELESFMDDHGMSLEAP